MSKLLRNNENLSCFKLFITSNGYSIFLHLDQVTEPQKFSTDIYFNVCVVSASTELLRGLKRALFSSNASV